MTFKELMHYYEFSHTKAAKAVDIHIATVGKWKRLNKVPFTKQCEYQIITKGKLIARKED